MDIKKDFLKEEKIDDMKVVNILKQWTIQNFILNKSIAFYADNDSDKLTDLPVGLVYDDYNPYKEDFDTPLSHLMVTLLNVGRVLQQKESEAEIRRLTEEEFGPIKGDYYEQRP